MGVRLISAISVGYNNTDFEAVGECSDRLLLFQENRFIIGNNCNKLKLIVNDSKWVLKMV